MTNYLVTGSSRGIGFELIRQLLAKPLSDVSTIFASARSANAPAFRQLLDEHPDRVKYIPLDVTDDASVKNAADLVCENLNEGGLDVLINNAGVLKTGRIEDMDDLDNTLKVNVSGVHAVTRAFLPLLRKGKEKKIMNISTTLGSITVQCETKMMSPPAYQISKAALNMLTVLYAQELDKEGFTVFCISPGWLKTDLGGQRAHLPVETGVSAVLDRLTTSGREANGKFVDISVPGWKTQQGTEFYTGKEIPW